MRNLRKSSYKYVEAICDALHIPYGEGYYLWMREVRDRTKNILRIRKRRRVS